MNCLRGRCQPDKAEPQEASAETPRRTCPPAWARLIAKIYQIDPLVCTRRLDHLGLGTPPQDKPPPAREILRVAEHGEGWGVPAEWA